MGTFFKNNWFVLGIFFTLIVGFLIPEVGIALNSRSIFSNTVIVLLFLISGLKLPSESIRAGMSDVRVHLFIQFNIFILSPAFFWLTSLPFRGVLDGQFVVGVYALACLPTTISSCIIFTQMAEGNVVATMFNAALANVAGVIVSPLILSLMLKSAGRPLPLSELLGILQGLSLKMLLPIIVGQFMRKIIRSRVDSIKKPLSMVSNVFILSMLFFAFTKTAKNPDFLVNLEKMIIPFIYLAISYLILLGFAYGGGRVLRFSHENLISVLFAAPQKTLAMGVPLLGTYFASNPDMLGVALLPLIFYHPWQLFIAGFIPKFMEKRAKRAG